MKTGKKNSSMKDRIDEWLRRFEKMTKQEADNIECIVRWDEETRTAFLLAKNIFEVEDEDENVDNENNLE